MKKKKKSFSNLWIVLVLIMLMVAWGWWMKANNKGQATEPIAQFVIKDTAPLQQVKMPEDVKSEIVHYPGYTVSFNSDYHVPNWSAWELTRDESKATEVSRKQVDFSSDFSVYGCPDLEDYRGSGYDRGHMCPAGDMKWDYDAMTSCFYLTNMCPQDQSLNNGTWRILEEKCRVWADRDSAIVIICGPVLSDKITRTVGEMRVAVPERFFKVILAPFSDPIRGIGFVMPNGPVKGGLQASAVSIDEVEAITGFDFFEWLPDEIENKVEADCNFPQWSQY